ncbi:mRNA-decapping enzyme-like protein [Thalictrum thalictroides]|uniref:mRNA-decapping enzyme-like protein n=1 Tax=Thalictrum thalictroides TaxID=46969 RepID=A0A7J6VW44_THATH|nr:mRNA-decapping enzyme-like protein [Thalictrum thalictroides]
MSPNVKLLPNLDQESTKVLNLTVLQRIDPFIEEILITAAHVTLYDFSIERSEWSRKDVEGSLFVVKRNTQPRFQFIVMNRRNTDNLVENLLGDFEYEIQIPYLLYRNASQDVNGVWFYNTRDCEDVGNLFSRILNAYSKVSPKPQVSLTKSDFEELEVTVMEGPLKPSSSTTSIMTNIQEDLPFVNIFSAATSTGNTSYMTNAGQTHQPPAVIPPSSQSPNLLFSPVPVMLPPATLSTSSAQSLPPLDISHMRISNHATNLVNPSTFLMPPSSNAVLMPPTPSSKPTAASPHPLVSPQRPYGAPVLQPFPPPTPPVSLTPTNGPIITRDKVRDTLMRLVQNHQFIDMFYEELSKGTN